MMDLNTVMLIFKAEKSTFPGGKKSRGKHVSTAVEVELEVIKKGAIKEGPHLKEGQRTSWQINTATILWRGTYSK